MIAKEEDAIKINWNNAKTMASNNRLFYCKGNKVNLWPKAIISECVIVQTGSQFFPLNIVQLSYIQSVSRKIETVTDMVGLDALYFLTN